jgi:parallel beta-helix repeat protein
MNDSNQGINFYNNKAWDMAEYGFMSYASALGSATFIENNTIYNCGTGDLYLYISAGSVLKNNLFFKSAEGSCFTRIDASTGYNNCGDDATGANANWLAGSGNIINCTPLNEVISLDDTNDNFLVVRPDATNCNDGGVAPGIVGNTAGIEGNARPASNGSYSIGANQWLSTHPCTRTVWM